MNLLFDDMGSFELLDDSEMTHIAGGIEVAVMVPYAVTQTGIPTVLGGVSTGPYLLPDVAPGTIINVTCWPANPNYNPAGPTNIACSETRNSTNIACFSNVAC